MEKVINVEVALAPLSVPGIKCFNPNFSLSLKISLTKKIILFYIKNNHDVPVCMFSYLYKMPKLQYNFQCDWKVHKKCLLCENPKLDNTGD